MKTFSLVAFLCCTFCATIFGNSQLPHLLTDKKNEGTSAMVTTSVYGDAHITLYPDGTLKKVRCRAPKDSVCAKITQGQSTYTVTIYNDGIISGEFEVTNYTHSIDSSGDDVLEF